MDINSIDLGFLIALIGLVIKSSQDKARQAEEMGRLKQQVASLEARGSRWDDRFSELDSKLERLLAAVTRVETVLQTQAADINAIRTPAVYRDVR